MDDYISRKEHEEFARRMADENHRQNRRIENLEEQMSRTQSIAGNLESLAESMKLMLEEQRRQGDEQIRQGEEQRRQGEQLEKHEEQQEKTNRRIDFLEGKPGKMWDKLITGIIGAIAAAIGAGLVLAVANYII